LTVLDVAYNRVGQVSGLEGCKELNELWLNMNKIEDAESTLKALGQLKKLKTVYLADNQVVEAFNTISGSEGYHLYLKS